LPVSRIEVDEYECAFCGYKWISRVNGSDRPKPVRCAKCKKQSWDKGRVAPYEKSYRDRIKHKFGYWFVYPPINRGAWRIEENVQRFLAQRPSIDDMKLVLKPMCYCYKNGAVPTPDRKYVDLDATEKARKYEEDLSRQILQQLMERDGIPYDEEEPKRISLGPYGTWLRKNVPKLCDDLKNEHPEFSNEDVKARVLEDLEGIEGMSEEAIRSSFPDWLIGG
jgi:hypothetical protein